MRRSTVFCDIDGVLFKHENPSRTCNPSFSQVVLSGVVEKFVEWEKLGHCVVLVTARKESARNVTEASLRAAGIFYDQLVMNIGNGKRFLINDRKPDGQDTSFSVNLDRDEGISAVTIE